MTVWLKTSHHGAGSIYNVSFNCRYQEKKNTGSGVTMYQEDANNLRSRPASSHTRQNLDTTEQLEHDTSH